MEKKTKQCTCPKHVSLKILGLDSSEQFGTFNSQKTYKSRGGVENGATFSGSAGGTLHR